MPRVSVLLPVHQAEATLPACLESLRRQSFEDWDCVLVDDGSTDATVALARQSIGGDRRFTILERPHRGLVETLNAGLAHCRGEYVARMDADDLMTRARLEHQTQGLDADASLVGVGSHVRIFPRRAMGSGLRAYERWLRSIDGPECVRREAFVECPVPHPTWMVRREVLAAYPYRDAGWPEDYDLLLRLLGDGLAFGVIPRPLLAWREHARRLTHTADAYRIEQFPRLKAAHLRRGFLSATETYILWGYGQTGRALRRALLAHDRRPSYIVEVHPGRLGQRIHGAEVIPPERLAALRGQPVVTSVAGAGPRNEVRNALLGMGFAELRDFVCAA